MKLQIADLKADLEASFKKTLREELDNRQVGGAGYAQQGEIMAKLDALIEKMTAVTATAATAGTASTEDVDFGGSGAAIIDDEESDEEEDIVLTIEQEDKTTAARKRAKIIRERTAQQLQQRKRLVGYHHGHYSVLPSTWQYPKACTVVQLCNLWLLGIPKESVPPLRKVTPVLVKHFDKNARKLSAMRAVMNEIEKIAREQNVWVKKWTSSQVTAMWSAVLPRINPYLCSQRNKNKSRPGQIAWRTCYNNMCANGLFVGNKARKSRTSRTN